MFISEEVKQGKLCIVCQTPLTGRQQVLCSQECRKIHGNKTKLAREKELKGEDYEAFLAKRRRYEKVSRDKVRDKTLEARTLARKQAKEEWIIREAEKQKKEIDRPITDKELKELGASGGRQSKKYRAAISELMNRRMLMDFKANGVEAIERVREENPAKYIELVMKLLPEEKTISVEHSFVSLLQEVQTQSQIKYAKEKVIN